MIKRVRRSQGERRGEIAAAALRLLGRGGLVAVNSAAVAAEVGVSPAALFRHFDTLDAIIEAAGDLAIARLDESIPGTDAPPVSRLRALAQARVRLLASEPGIAWLLRSEQAYSSLPASVVRRLRQAIRRSRTFIETALREGVGRGEIRSDVGSQVLLAVFTATMHSLVSQGGLAQRAANRLEPGEVIAGVFHLFRIASEEVIR